jgi:hypothetical protein
MKTKKGNFISKLSEFSPFFREETNLTSSVGCLQFNLVLLFLLSISLHSFNPSLMVLEVLLLLITVKELALKE